MHVIKNGCSVGKFVVYGYDPRKRVSFYVIFPESRPRICRKAAGIE